MQVFECARDRHLFGPGPKRILALDGGGVRGALTIAFLERLEELLETAAGKPVRLCDWFDLIGGTSTGAILATGLALGHSAREMHAYYTALAPNVFHHSIWRVPGWSSKFDASRLRTELVSIIGDRRLDSTDLQTGLGIILKRIDTGGAWILINNPKSKYWETPAGGAYIGNSEMHLAKIVRASTAAPNFFDPELIDVVEGHAPGLFIDGALTPHNNPSLALYVATMMPPVGLNWASGPRNLDVVSIGAGSFRATLSTEEAERLHAIGFAVRALMSQIADNEKLVLTLMSWLGTTSTRWSVDSELGDVGAITPPFGTQFRFGRFDVRLEQSWLKEVLDLDIDVGTIQQLRLMDDPMNMAKLYELGQAAAAKQMKLEHFI